MRESASDAIGVFCAIRCYFMQILNEDNGTANIKLDRVGMTQFLTARYLAVFSDLQTLVMAERPGCPGYAQGMALSYLKILQSKHSVQLPSLNTSSRQPNFP